MTIITQDAVRAVIIDFAAHENRKIDGEVTNDRKLLDDRIIDSLSFLNLIMFMEERFGIELDLSDFEAVDFETVSDLADALSDIAKA
ncbi:acyl carrier protein [Algimonas porphyrae]|uniref:Carrier domain-containing protein n=1 Tax=Algimonas porphyrae TaxID=1128113 RepID=A0ABQ5V366_9PROT|nr:acyl carrier protein [Algimonas porphyrae]GLQ21975.1 hypothetical protein GCM10007854_29300 [Algimonas porphyrae]